MDEVVVYSASSVRDTVVEVGHSILSPLVGEMAGRPEGALPVYCSVFSTGLVLAPAQSPEDGLSGSSMRERSAIIRIAS